MKCRMATVEKRKHNGEISHLPWARAADLGKFPDVSRKIAGQSKAITERWRFSIEAMGFTVKCRGCVHPDAALAPQFRPVARCRQEPPQ
jgi:hypothetical protein